MNQNSIINPTNVPGMGVGTLADLLNVIVPLLTLGAVILFGVALISAGFRVLVAGDDVEAYTKAKATAMYSVLGLVLVISAYLIVKLVEFMFGIDLPL